MLSARPASMAEIAAAKKAWNDLQARRGAARELAELCDSQRKLLAASAGGLFDLAQADVDYAIDAIAQLPGATGAPRPVKSAGVGPRARA